MGMLKCPSTSNSAKRAVKFVCNKSGGTLTGLCCYGTDREAARVNSFTAVFIHLRCFCENIEHKLQQLNIFTSTIKEYIFGIPS